jgi:hypothetical protein
MERAADDGERRLRYGLVILAKADPRLLRATLRSVGELTRPPDRLSVVMPAGRHHVFADAVSAAAPAPVQTVSCRIDRSALEQGFGSLAAEVDIVLFVPEGVILASDYLDVLADKAARWDDLVGEIDMVSDAVKCPVGAALPDLAALRRSTEWAALPVLRRFLRARSAMAVILWLRVAACGGIKFVQLPEFCDFIACALFLDWLRWRGRTGLLFTRRARHIRLMPERRTGFDVGYVLFSKLGHIAAFDERRNLAAGRESYLREDLEMARLLGEQALQLVMSPRSKRHVATFLQGMWAARRAARMQQQKSRREIRELG